METSTGGGNAAVVQELKAAAALLRQRASQATPGLYIYDGTAVRAPLPQGERGRYADGRDPLTGEPEVVTVAAPVAWPSGQPLRPRAPHDLAFIELMDPGVGMAVVALLEEAASDAQADWDDDAEMTQGELEARYTAPLNIARLLLAKEDQR